MEEPNHKPNYIPQIGIPEKSTFQDKNYTRAVYHKATAPGFFGVIVLCFFMSFINVKCGNSVVATYTGIEIMIGVNKTGISHNNGSVMVGVRQSAYNQLQVAKANFQWKRTLKENFQENADDAPLSDEDFSAMEDFYKMPQSYEDTTSNPKTTSALARLAFIVACIGFVLSFLKSKFGTSVQIAAGIFGFVFLLLMQVYVKVTLPKTSSSTFSNEYSAPMISTQFALGYWVALFLFLAVAVLGILKFKWQKKINSSE